MNILKSTVLCGALLLAGCQGYVRADALDPALYKVLDRHDDYVRKDKELTPLQSRTALRSSELLRKTVKEAQDTDQE